MGKLPLFFKRTLSLLNLVNRVIRDAESGYSDKENLRLFKQFKMSTTLKPQEKETYHEAK